MGTLCRLWSQRVLSDGRYWQWAQLRVSKQYPNQNEDLLNSRILTLVPAINVTQWADENLAESLLKKIRKGGKLKVKKLTITFGTNRKLLNLDLNLLAKASLQVEEFCIDGGRKYHEAILTVIRDSPNNGLRHLHLGDEILRVAPDLLAGAAMKLESIQASIQTKLQVNGFMTRLAASPDSRLKSLPDSFRGKYLQMMSDIPPEILARALLNVENVDTPTTYWMDEEHISVFINMIRESSNARLSNVQFLNSKFTHLPPEVLVGAVQKLEEVQFRGGHMTVEQATSILTMIKERRLGKIKKIVMGSIIRDITSVSPSLLQEAKLNPALTWHARREMFSIYH